MDEYLESMRDDMAKSLDSLKRDLAKVRTGRATPQLVEGVQVVVQSYGATMPLNQLATIQAADARLLVLTPWDKGTMADIEKSILAAGLGLNPSNDGKIIRLPVPPLTQERRRDLVKVLRAAAEEAKVRIRHVRREYNDLFRKGEEDGDISEDDCRKFLDKVQVSTDDAVSKVDQLAADKEKEVLEV